MHIEIKCMIKVASLINEEKMDFLVSSDMQRGKIEAILCAVYQDKF